MPNESVACLLLILCSARCENPRQKFNRRFVGLEESSQCG